MSLTIEELKERMSERLDEVTILEVLEINSQELVERFTDKIEDNYDKLNEQLSDE